MCCPRSSTACRKKTDGAFSTCARAWHRQAFRAGRMEPELLSQQPPAPFFIMLHPAELSSTACALCCLPGEELSARSGDMLQQPYARAFAASSPGYEGAPVWHSTGYHQEQQPQVMHSRPQSGPQELYQPQLSAPRSQRSGISVPVQHHRMEFDQAPTQVQYLIASCSHTQYFVPSS